MRHDLSLAIHKTLTTNCFFLEIRRILRQKLFLTSYETKATNSFSQAIIRMLGITYILLYLSMAFLHSLNGGKTGFSQPIRH